MDSSEDTHVTPEKRPRVDGLRLVSVVDAEAPKEHARWRFPDVEARRETTHACPLEEAHVAIAARTAERCDEGLGQDRSAEEEKLYGASVKAPKEREPAAWKRFKILEPVIVANPSKVTVDARWVAPWMVAEGKEDVKAPCVAHGYQDPDLENGMAEAPGCLSLRSSHLQVVSLVALRKETFWTLGIKNAALRWDGSIRDISLRAHAQKDPNGARLI